MNQRVVDTQVMAGFGQLQRDMSDRIAALHVRIYTAGSCAIEGRFGIVQPIRHLVQLHLSRDCNRPSLAAEVGRAALDAVGSAAAVTTAQQYAVSHIISLDADFKRTRPAAVPANGAA